MAGPDLVDAAKAAMPGDGQPAAGPAEETAPVEAGGKYTAPAQVTTLEDMTKVKADKRYGVKKGGK